MTDGKTAYQIWAPDDVVWAQWAKPVLFAGRPASGGALKTQNPKWISSVDYSTMLVLDLPGREGVEEGLALAKMGYRPVPLYNGVPSPNKESMIIDVSGIVSALFQGADELALLTLRPDAPPVFLLDSYRMRGQGRPHGKFDNRWCVFPQDMPSASFLQQQGISHVIVRTKRVENDLLHILRRYQEKKIRISMCSDTGRIRELIVAKPSRFQSMLYRFRTISGLSRNAAGGFGARIPEPTQSSGSGVRYYGHG